MLAASFLSSRRSRRNAVILSRHAVALGGAADGGQYLVHRRRPDVRRVAAEVQNVELRQPQMLEDLPRRVRVPLGCDASQGRPNALDGRVEAGVRIVPIEQPAEVCAQVPFVIVHFPRS